VQAISGRDEDISARALERAGGRVKPAVLIALGTSEEEAEDALREAEGRLDAAIEHCTNQTTTTGRLP
jgi:N-acetylmuramic acid 6-phosphate (MurNAc-6-P) etherase